MFGHPAEFGLGELPHVTEVPFIVLSFSVVVLADVGWRGGARFS